MLYLVLKGNTRISLCLLMEKLKTDIELFYFISFNKDKLFCYIVCLFQQKTRSAQQRAHTLTTRAFFLFVRFSELVFR